VKDVKHLATIMAAVRGASGVQRVERARS
jgi:hypothetical protein